MPSSSNLICPDSVALVDEGHPQRALFEDGPEDLLALPERVLHAPPAKGDQPHHEVRPCLTRIDLEGLLELGIGFTFAARQKRITVDGDAVRIAAGDATIDVSVEDGRLRVAISGRERGELTVAVLRDRVEAAGGTVSGRRAGEAMIVEVDLPTATAGVAS